MTKPEVKAEEDVKTPTGRGRKRKTEAEVATTGVSDKKAKKEAEVRVGSFFKCLMMTQDQDTSLR